MRSDFVRDAGREPIFNSAISRQRRHLPEKCLEAFRFIDQPAIRLEASFEMAVHALREARDLLHRSRRGFQ